MEDTKLTKRDIIDVAVSVGIILVSGFIVYKAGVDSGKKQYQKTMIRLARKNGGHKLTVTYF